MPLLYLFGKRDAQTINIINQINSKKMENKFTKVSSTNNKILSLSVIIAGCILVAIPMATVANLAGAVLFITGIILIFVLKNDYKCIETGDIFCKKEFYFEDRQKEKLLNAIKNNPKTIDITDIDKGNTLRLDIFYSKKGGKAFMQLYKYIPYQYEPCSEIIECEYNNIEKIVK